MEADDSIVVAFAADQNYFDGLLVSAGSMARHASSDVWITWIILDGGIRKEDIAFLAKVIQASHEKSVMRVINFAESLPKGIMPYKGSFMTYARLYLAKLLPECDFVLYSDVDFLWLADVKKLWDMRDEKFFVQSTIDECASVKGWKPEDEWAERNGFVIDRKHYFCAGLCLFNLAKLREGMLDRLFQTWERYPDVPLVDQTVMNIVIPKEGIGWLPLMWQRIVCELTPEKVSRDVVLHYAGVAPWKAVNTKFLTDVIWVWFNEYSKLCNVSTWKAVGRVHNLGFAVVSRTIFWLAVHFGVVKWLLRRVLRLVGHEGYMTLCFRCEKFFK